MSMYIQVTAGWRLISKHRRMSSSVVALYNFLVVVSAVLCLCVSSSSARTQLLNDPAEEEQQQYGICTSMVETQGYACEEHTVITKDGYILSVQRIPHGRRRRPGPSSSSDDDSINSNSQSQTMRPPVLLQHGLTMDAGTWLLSPPDEALAFVLADEGYDVWLPNSRGTNYSRRHTSLHPNDPAYWDWTWDELAAYDLPATVEYVRHQTHQNVHYAAHSLGTLMALAAFSQGQVLDMLKSAALLSPIAYLGHIRSPLAKAAADVFLGEVLYWLGMKEFAPEGEAAAKLLEAICSVPGISCSDLMSAFTGPNCCLNSTMAVYFLQHEPQSTSTKNMIHIAQMIRQGSIAKYDYGSEEGNKKHYGQPNPPAYNMSSIPKSFPLLLGYGGQDFLSDVEDVHKLLDDHLNHHDPDKLTLLYKGDYAHADFCFAVNAKQQVYDSVIHFIRAHG